MADFKWHPSEPPPQIEDHTRAKLDVLRRYLAAYFDRLNVNPHREEFKLDLVDGFCGGGSFVAGDKTVSGSPLIMLEEAEAATVRLNQGRTKRLRVDCRFYFVDKEQASIDHLNKYLADRGYDPADERIVVQCGLFEHAIENILGAIRRRQPRAGRAIFLLDQTGFSQVDLRLVARILSSLPRAEVILTFAVDALVNHLSETRRMIKAVARLELSDDQIEQLIQHRTQGERALVQRTLRPHILETTGATYDTPFFIRPERSRRSLWFLHLSRHPTARDVMIRQHWELQNTFEHDGSGGLDMMGWDPLRESTNLPLFGFQENDEQRMLEELADSLAHELFALTADAPIAVETVHHLFANRTAARFEDLDAVILRLMREGELQVLSPEGRARSRSLEQLKSTDRIAFRDTLLLPVISRIR